MSSRAPATVASLTLDLAAARAAVADLAGIEGGPLYRAEEHLADVLARLAAAEAVEAKALTTSVGKALRLASSRIHAAAARGQVIGIRAALASITPADGIGRHAADGAGEFVAYCLRGRRSLGTTEAREAFLAACIARTQAWRVSDSGRVGGAA